MPLIDLQRRLAEVGRIRMGEKNGNRPTKRDTWRITSRDKARLEAVHAIYPGELRPWDNSGSAEWELLTETDSLDVMVLPGQTLSQWYELWSGGGCQRRCDGGTMIVPGDQPCMCPQDPEERAELAGKGKACKATSRLSVMLPNVQGFGMWRLETHGYYAAVELAGIADLLERATAQGEMLPARLRIDQRTSVKDGLTRRFPVPMLEVEATPNEIRQLATGPSTLESRNRAALPPAPPSGEPQGDGDALELEAVDDVEVVVDVADPVVPGSDAVSVPMLSESQRRKVFAAARAATVGEPALREILARVTGQESTAAIPASKLDEVLAAIEGAK